MHTHSQTLHVYYVCFLHLAAWNPRDPLNMEQVSAFLITIINCSNTNLNSCHHLKGTKHCGKYVNKMTANGKMDVKMENRQIREKKVVKKVRNWKLAWVSREMCEVRRNELGQFSCVYCECRVTDPIITIRMFLCSKGKRQSQAKWENIQQVETAVKNPLGGSTFARTWDFS